MQSSLIMVNNESVKIKPFIKWVGGKRNIINHLIKGLPENIKNTLEIIPVSNIEEVLKHALV